MNNHKKIQCKLDQGKHLRKDIRFNVGFGCYYQSALQLPLNDLRGVF